jgi:hypothetical protein
MSRKKRLLLAVALVFFAAVGVVIALKLTLFAESNTSSAERNACYSLRDVLADLNDDSAKINDITPDVRAVTRNANRSDNDALRQRAAAFRAEWGEFARASESHAQDSVLQNEYDQFIDAYSRLVTTCEGLGIEIG